MTEAEWLACKDPTAQLNFIFFDAERGASARRNRLFACACARRVWSHLSDERSRGAVETAERYVDNEATIDELKAAWERSATQDDGGGVQIPRELDFSAAAAAAWATATNDQAAAVNGCVHAACAVGRPSNDPWLDGTEWDSAGAAERTAQASLLQDLFGNPFRPLTFSPGWRTDTTVTLASTMYESRDFGAMPILADALQDAGCEEDQILAHCRGPGPHVRGCWVVDLVLGKE
jgi:hypothetical protein